MKPKCKRVKTAILKNRYKENRYEKSPFIHLGQRHFLKSPTQAKARDVIRKYKSQLRKMEFKRLKNLVPAVKETSDEDSNEVSNPLFMKP